MSHTTIRLLDSKVCIEERIIKLNAAKNKYCSKYSISAKQNDPFSLRQRLSGHVSILWLMNMLRQKQHAHQDQGSDCALVFGAGGTTPSVLCPVLGPLIQEEH